MDNGVGVHNRILLSCEGKWDDEIYWKMDETGNYRVKGGIAGSEREVSLPSSHVQALTSQGMETRMV